MIYYITKRLFVSLQINLVNKCRFIYLSSAFAVVPSDVHVNISYLAWGGPRRLQCARHVMSAHRYRVYTQIPESGRKVAPFPTSSTYDLRSKELMLNTQMRSSFSSGDCVACIQCDKIGEVNPLFIQNFGDPLCSISMGAIVRIYGAL